MFISVDFPAPFSPRSACTSPRRRSKSTWSLATMPGKRLVIPRISRTVEASTAGDSMEVRRMCARLQAGRDGDLARDDALLERVHLVDEGLRDGGVDPADGHAAVGERELQVR